ncbi:hypothetical protein [Brevibacillus panacihumi]|uniref:hypothetical protein n=1 Tax=Brevibacillus panacihumi TaxID=497735 RepID=UPI003D1AFB62
MSTEQRWFPLPVLYRALDDPETLLRYAAAYMRRRHPEWKPVKLNNYRVLAERSGSSDGEETND